MKIAVSACLTGINCKYSGGNNLNAELMELLAGHEVITVCPEVLGGLPTPRPPAEIVNGTVINEQGTSVDLEYRSGAEKAIRIIEETNCMCAILQSRSPSCGIGTIYDGSFSKVRIPGNGIFAQRCIDEGIPCFDVADLSEIREFLRKKAEERKCF